MSYCECEIVCKNKSEKKDSCQKFSRQHCDRNNKCKIKCDNKCKNEKIDKCDDFLQQQINYLNCKIEKLTKKSEEDKIKYNSTINQINNMYDLIDNGVNLLNINNGDCCKCGTEFYETGKTHQYIAKCDGIIYITAVGGGGSGGIGKVSENGTTYYSGGGGGSGACIIKRPYSVVAGAIISVTIGHGGDAKMDKHGQDTVITITSGGKTETIIVCGGSNGNPNCVNGDDCVNGGIGGKSDVPLFSGSNGQDGLISIPSMPSVIGGNGGGSIFYSGGQGGSNYFGNGGNGGNSSNLSGSDGRFGSGGGGSIPIFNPDANKLCGCGGSGLCIIDC